MGDLVRGVVTSVDARGAWVDAGGERLFCRVRGRLFGAGADTGTPVAPGDEVRLSRTSPGEGAVEEVVPRRSRLSRRGGPHGGSERVLAANVDQVAIVASVARPPLRPGLIDRLVVASANQGLEALVVLNKIDLGREDLAAEVRRTYAALGLPVFLVSAREGTGIAGLAGALAGRVTVLAGHSGVGKSSLLNAIQPSLRLRVGELGRRTSRGHHTTSRAELLPLAGGGYVVDTPGVRAFGLWDIEAADLDIFFREFEPHIERCRFHDCTHSHEPECAVRAALAAGEIPRSRYEAYLRILDTLETGREGGRPG